MARPPIERPCTCCGRVFLASASQSRKGHYYEQRCFGCRMTCLRPTALQPNPACRQPETLREIGSYVQTPRPYDATTIVER